MMPFIDNALAAFPIFIAHFAIAVAIVAVGVAIYMAMTPYNEVRLIRAANTAAGIVLAGAIIGLALPVAVSLENSLSAFDIIVWGVVAIVVQLATYGAVNLVLRGVARHIEAGENGAAVVLAAAQISVGLVNAGAIAV